MTPRDVEQRLIELLGIPKEIIGPERVEAYVDALGLGVRYDDQINGRP